MILTKNNKIIAVEIIENKYLVNNKYFHNSPDLLRLLIKLYNRKWKEEDVDPIEFLENVELPKEC